MSPLPREAREGLMRAFCKILEARHPGTIWVPVEPPKKPDDDPPDSDPAEEAL